MKFFRIMVVIFILVIAFGLSAQTVSADIQQAGPIEPGFYEKFSSSSNPGLTGFAQSVKNGLSHQVTGVYIENVLSFPVVQQPILDAAYVSTKPDTITQFRMAAQYKTIGLLAHDYLAGATFPEIQPGSDVFVVFGDGSSKRYQVYDIQKYQALSPTDPYSSFVDLSNQKRLNADSLFYHTYGLGNSTLVLQTCISTPSAPSWGRIFILAQPVETSPAASFWYSFPLFQQALAGMTVH